AELHLAGEVMEEGSFRHFRAGEDHAERRALKPVEIDLVLADLEEAPTCGGARLGHATHPSSARRPTGWYGRARQRPDDGSRLWRSARCCNGMATFRSSATAR